MPIELAGISNVNDFYSEHYLQTVFEGDIQDLRARWREEEKADETPPDRMLEKLGKRWSRLASDYKAERNDRKRLLIFREFEQEFLGALGYAREFQLVPDAEQKLIPVTARRVDAVGRDRVWVVETVAPRDDVDFATGPLQLRFRCEQFEGIDDAVDVEKRRKDTAEAAINKGIFAEKHPPRFVILLSMAHAVLIDREKWGESRLLSFDLGEIFTRGDFATVSAVAALLHATSLAPDSGTPLVDRIDEESHRHAYGVSQDLKFSLREAIELLGNEAASLIVEKRLGQSKGVYTGKNALDAGILSTECLRYMYRLLFLLYIEARPQLGFAPMNAKAYRSGYSLEALRDLALVPLETEEDKDGYFISDTIETLFSMVFDGTPAAGMPEQAQQEVFTFAPVRARLFDPDAIGTYLKGLRFRNSVMQRILELLSLSREARGRSRGRISYVTLGISQLGAVYESLLSFSGFFASTDLIELKPKDKPNPGPLEAAYFAPAKRAGDFEQAEIVYEGNSPKSYPQGTFIYRLSGRNRENSASYYTPEPLARTLVKYALKELLEGKKADDILKLKVIEPAMGSAAFLVEVVNQLTDRYLELKQAELGRRIPHEERADVERRVRAYLADRNVFGVDLNPIAVELGQISLWLDCLHKGGHAPWFDDQVHCGNSLVGARRAVFPVASLTAKREDDRWHKRKPREIGWSGESRKRDEVWHFLLPDPGMSAYDQDIVRPLAPEAWAEFAAWRRDFMKPLDSVEVQNLQRISSVIDQLFGDVADRLAEMRASVNDEIAIWPAKPGENEKHIDFSEKIKRLKSFHGDELQNSVAWRRLRTAMDAWCALWFWPIDKAALLPARASFIADIALVLEGRMGGKLPTVAESSARPVQGVLFETVSVPGAKFSGKLLSTEERAAALAPTRLFGDVDIDKLVAASAWLPTAMEVASRCRFMHFDLEFADVMRERRGFDLVIGNPPWLKPTWFDPDILSEWEPVLGIRDFPTAEVEKMKLPLLQANHAMRDAYLLMYPATASLQSFLAAKSCFPTLDSGQPNLYKGFIDLALRITAPNGVSALIHQDNHLTEPEGGSFREIWYKRIKRHYHFRNAITKKMFAEVKDGKKFSLNIYSGTEHEIEFDHIATLLLPHMIDECYSHDGIGAIPSLKKPEGGWDIRGHKKRVVKIDAEVLNIFATVVEDGNVSAARSRFLFPFSTDTVEIFRALGAGSISFDEAARPFQMKPLWHESAATKKLKTIEGCVEFPESDDEVILTGSLIHVANSTFRSPTADGKREALVDLNLIPNDYRVRNYYKRSTSRDKYDEKITRLDWDKAALHTDQYRLAFRRMLDLRSERSLVCALIPPGVAHVNTIESIAFNDEKKLLAAYPLWLSLPFDFLVKATGLSDLRESNLRFFPWAEVCGTAVQRAMRLSCTTASYSALWNRHFNEWDVMPWSTADSRLLVESSHQDVACKWSRASALRSDFARRQALIEIDVLVAQALGLNISQLIEMYRTLFDVLEENEAATWYDSNGRVAWTKSKALSGIGIVDSKGKKISGPEWIANYAGMEDGKYVDCDLSPDFLNSKAAITKRRYIAPFVLSSREADYRRAWAFFEAQSKKKAA